jgi:uncharacterized protein YbaR (Trm112 family)
VFVELVSALRCPAAHEETWLVAASERTVGRSILEGVLGCPVCHAEYRIHDGVAEFAATAGNAGASTAPAADEEEVVRLAALLDLASPGGLVILGGEWDGCADALGAITDARLLLVNPTRHAGPSEPRSAIRVGDVLPVAPAACRAIALDADTATVPLLASAVRALRPGGRLAAPAACPMPDGVVELARDDRHWVAERDRDAVALAPVRLRRA